MPKKGTPGYDKWLADYRAKKGIKVEEVSTGRQKKIAKPEQLSLFSKEELQEIMPKDILPKGTKRMVHSKSQNKDLQVEIIRFVPKNGKYLVSRQDGKFLYYGPSELKEVSSETQAKSVEPVIKIGDSVAIVPPGSLSAKIEEEIKPAVQDLNYAGMQIDSDMVNSMIVDHEAKLESAQQQIDAIAGSPVNVNAVRVLQSLLYEKEKLPRVNGNSTSEETLQELASIGRSQLPSLIMEWRSHSKLLKSYLYKLRDLAAKGDGKLHNLFDTAALSGRFTTKHNPIAVEVPDATPTEKKIYFQEDLDEIGLGSVCPI